MRKRKHLFGAILLTLGILFWGFGASGNFARATSGTSLSTANELEAAFRNGGTYTISGEINTNRPSDDSPLIVQQGLTINGGTIGLSNAGMVLGADATFNNTTLIFSNPAYLGIFTNGHNLTLNGVTIKWGHMDPFSISAGGVGNNQLFSATAGSGSTITLNNVTISSTASVTQGLNLYAGNIYNITPLTINADGSTGPAQSNNDAGVTFPVTMEISGISGGKAAVYAHGATYTGVKEGNTNISTAYYDKIVPSTGCIANGGVVIKLKSGSDVSLVNGATGIENAGATVQVTSVNGYSDSLTVTNIGRLELNKNGGANPKLTLKNGGYSSFYPNANVVVPQDTLLNLTQVESSLSINDFIGGGSLVLGQSQRLTITGQVTGNTKVGIGEIFNDRGKLPTENHAYISAPSSADGAFTLLPPSTHPQMVFTNQNGNWGVYTSEDGSNETTIDKIESISIRQGYETVKVAPDSQTIYEGLDIVWADGVDEEFADLGTIPLTVLYDSSSAVRNSDSGYYSYIFSVKWVQYILEIYGSELYFREVNDEVFRGLPEGSHTFYLSVPKEYMANNKLKTVSFKIVVEAEEDTNDGKNETVEAPVITQQPAATASYTKGGNAAAIEVRATGTGQLSYQWYKNSTNNSSGGTLIANEVASTFTPPTDTVGTFWYYCVVTNTDTATGKTASISSNTTEVTIEPADGQASVQMDDWSYGETASNPKPQSDTNGVGTVTYSYSGRTKNGNSYGPTSKKPVDAGEYTVTAIFGATGDYKEVRAEDTFTINQASKNLQDSIGKGIGYSNTGEQRISLLKSVQSLPGYLQTDTGLTYTPNYSGSNLVEIKMVDSDLSFRLKEGLTDGAIGSETITVGITGMNNYSQVTLDMEVSIIDNAAATPENIWVSGFEEGMPYTGQKIVQSFQLYDGEVLLKENTDYTVSYKNNTNAYEWTASSGGVAVKSEGTERQLMNADGTIQAAENNNIDRKKAPQLIIKMKGNYSGTYTMYFQIRKTDLNDGAVKADDLFVTYNNKSQRPIPVVTWQGKALKYKKDFDVQEYVEKKNDKEAFIGAADNQTIETLTLVGMGNFAGTKKIQLVIGQKNGEKEEIPMSKVTVKGIKNLNWNEDDAKSGDGLTQGAITVKYKTDVLEDKGNVPDSGEYTVSYENNTAVGTATIILEGTGEDADKDGYAYIGTKRITFKINGINISKAKISGLLKSYTYTGEEIKPTEGGSDYEPVTFAYQVRKGQEPIQLEKDVHYTVTYQKNINKGTATMVLDGCEEEGYTGTKKISFKIVAASMNDSQSAFQVNITDEAARVGEGGVIKMPYMKGGAKPAVTVENSDGDTLTAGIDYTVSYKNNTAVTTSTTAKVPAVVVKGKGNYSGTIEVPFEIVVKEVDGEYNGDVYIVAKDKIFSDKKNGWKQSIAVYDADGKKLSTRDYQSLEYKVGSLPVGYDTLKEGDSLGPASVMPIGSEVEVNITMTGNNYTGKVTGTYRILEAGYDISKATIRLKPQEYTGQEIEIDGNEDIEEAYLKIGKDVHYLYLKKDGENEANIRVVEGSYTKNVQKGTASVTFEGIGRYGGTKTKTFKIGQRSIENFWNSLLGW